MLQKESFLIQIIEKFPGSGYKNGEVDEEMRHRRLEREDWWMKTLRTIYPYGLNEKCKNRNVEEEAVGKLPRHKIRPIKRYRPKKENNKNKIINTNLLIQEIYKLTKKSSSVYTNYVYCLTHKQIKILGKFGA